jgi:hypothetical protein
LNGGGYHATVSALLVSDRDREYTVGLLRDHWVTGRLTAEEFEQRVAEACAARFSTDLWHALRWLPVDLPSPPKRGSGTAAVILSTLGWCVMLLTLGFGSPLALPLFIAGWVAGREAKRLSPGGAPTAAKVAQTLGLLGALASVLFIGGCAAIVASF